jgi:AP endonuclease-1
LGAKNVWNEHFTTYIRDLDKKKPVIWMGDMNVAPTEIGMLPATCSGRPRAHEYNFRPDLFDAEKNWNKTAGYTKDETEAFKNILDPPESATDAGKFIDVWRQRHPDVHHYTYFSYRFNCREKSLGWRLDMGAFCVSCIWYDC